MTNMEGVFCGNALACSIKNLDVYKGTVVQSFNSDISKWNTANVVNMGRLFHRALSFNRDISKWVSFSRLLDFM